MYVRAGRPIFARPCVGVHKSTSLMSSSLLLQQCPAFGPQFSSVELFKAKDASFLFEDIKDIRKRFTDLFYNPSVIDEFVTADLPQNIIHEVLDYSAFVEVQE